MREHKDYMSGLEYLVLLASFTPGMSSSYCLLSDMITNTCGTKQRLGCSFRPRQVWKRGVITPSSLVQSREQQESRPCCLVDEIVRLFSLSSEATSSGQVL